MSACFAISLASLVIRKPFTLQYAREMVDAETAQLPGFMRANYIITWAWTGAFLLMMVANVLMIYVPGLPLWSGIADRIRRPQQRRLFHQMVSGVPESKIRGASRQCAVLEIAIRSPTAQESIRR